MKHISNPQYLNKLHGIMTTLDNKVVTGIPDKIDDAG